MLTLKLITEQTDRVIKGLEKKHFEGAKEAIGQARLKLFQPKRTAHRQTCHLHTLLVSLTPVRKSRKIQTMLTSIQTRAIWWLSYPTELPCLDLATLEP